MFQEAPEPRIRGELDYRALLSQAESLRRTVEWERAHPPATIDPAAFDYAFYPSDLYYSDLATSDGQFEDWNGQKQGFHAGYFGEVRGEKNKHDPINYDHIDYRPDIAVGRWPVSTYPRWLRTGLTFLVPIAFAVTVPAQALTRRLNGRTLLFALGLAVLFVIFTRWFWRRGLRRYSGASA